MKSSEMVRLRASIHEALPLEARRIISSNAVSIRGDGQVKTYLISRHAAERAQRIAADAAGCIDVVDYIRGKSA